MIKKYVVLLVLVMSTCPLQAHEGNQPTPANLSRLSLTGDKDVGMFVGGLINEEFFVYNHCYTLRSDYGDQNDFFRHKLNLDLAVTQGEKKCGKPMTEGAVRLTNYVMWQDESHYMPLVVDQVALPDATSTVVASNVPVRNLVPMLFVEDAWLKLHLDTFAPALKDMPTSLKIGYFPYVLGRGLAMGYHEDLAVDYLGWAGDGGFTRYPSMPPGILLHNQISEHISWDAYFNLWRETNASISDVLKPTRQQRMDVDRPQRGSGKDTWSVAVRADCTLEDEALGKALVQPYALYTQAPEQTVEVLADASAKLLTVGSMMDWKKGGWHVNVELAGQFGYQRLHPLDRNTVQISGGGGAVTRELSHVLQGNDAVGTVPAIPAKHAHAIVQEIVPAGISTNFLPNNDTYLASLSAENRDLNKQSGALADPDHTRAQPLETDMDGNRNLFNSAVFGNNRFRPAYKLDHEGVMMLVEVSYTFENKPVKLAAAAGYISGDSYPYNNEVSHTFHGFIPQRSRYRGLAVKNFLIFDRLVIPRPLNISYRTLSAFNDVKDLSNLQFLGVGATWYPLKKRDRLSLTTDIMLLWEVAQLKAWDKKGTHPDPLIEAQLERLRNTILTGPGAPIPTLFSGWESTKPASRMLGAEFDFKVRYQLLDHCDIFGYCSFFVPGQLYKDLDGQPNSITQRVDKAGLLRYDSLGSSVAFAGMLGVHYKF